MKQHHPNVQAYMMVFGALMFLTVVTVAVSWLHLPKAPAIFLGLAIATLKASLVAAFFMHLKGERTLIYGLLGLTLVFLAILMTIPISDSVATAGTRHHLKTAGSKSHVP